ncbi:hypothetical protein CGCF415_v001822 [Colletotrichum fructicola]|uniref:Clr5 domain-containing protein n=1 Tax=Colletotrichum fructicola (strain Nara gc5) TaxID=1213859 RepID=L2FR70_COLFN|nr:uncharacterized protein CGMCC3_g3492 [Colletotrichum fructicola]KAF4478759.1 hypothetical protein CGGC5_v012495 [Colletotrichum fructicola Nara gc5]KAE9580487.1 hypothetical protein CGMCC3_g3492 [Colletotrichum fructicola]KAF4422580.1 hypothetical protein CFRS1_v001068 [Colletotrichum fructicola]KAF4900816.1 hypothetical protein CGCFRS4_v003225 [Colletotrichum fructicola]KAF4915141.1 hypothetical protein CGCF415_v001822 [Colletotrichum fructicola]
MVGQITYTEEQILFILRLSLENEKRDEILRQYHQRFNKPLTASQLRYVKGKYGHDPEFGTALINGALPTNGGARKTAPPSPPPKQKTRIVIKRPNNSINQGSSNTHSPCPTLPGPIQHRGPQHITTGHAPLHCQDSAFTGYPQQTIRTQSSLRYEAYPQPTGITNNAVSSHQPPPQPDPAWAPIWDPDHPYGYQPVLEHYKTQYNLNGSSKPATKRKREDSDDFGEQANGASLQEEYAVDAKRVKMESPAMNLQYAYPDYDPAVAHNSSWYQTQVSETTQMNENIAQAVSPLTGLLNQIDTEFLAQGNSPLAMSTAPSFSTLPMCHPYTGAMTTAPISASYLQTPQMGYFDPYPDATWCPGMDTNGTLLASSPNSLPSLSNQNSGVSSNETTSSWTTPYLDNMNEDGWHNTSSPLENSLLNTPMFDPALNQDLTPYMDPALLDDDQSGAETGQTQCSDHAVKLEEDTMRSDEDGTFDWEDMFDSGSSTNDESGQSQD